MARGSPRWQSPPWRHADLIDALLDWLAALPPVAVYAVLALLAALENLVPPVPADTAVALGAFLAHRGVTSLPVVYAVTLVANLAGAAGVYFAARRYGRRFFSTGAGQRLLTPEALAVVEREYLRYGVVGIFLGRFLPGIRAVVAPFAGLANLSAPRALIPMAVASAIWYGLITALGAAIGARWESIAAILSRINTTLGIITLVLLGVAAVLYVRHRRRQGRDLLWGLLRQAVGPRDGDERSGEEALRDAALLMLELAYAEPGLTERERLDVEQWLRRRYGLEERPSPAAPSPEGATLSGYRERFLDHFEHERREALLERLWLLAFEQGSAQRARDRLARHAAASLGFSVDDLARVEGRVRQRGGDA